MAPAAPQQRARHAAAARRPPGGLPAALGALSGGMLASSCCLIQLALNVSSIGCVGFSVLTPHRNWFRALTGGCVGWLLLRHGATRRNLATALLSVLLMLSQDLLAAHNQGRLGGLRQLLSGASRLAPGGRAPPPPVATRTVLRVRGMRCEACAARVRGNLVALDGVDGCTVQLQEGMVEVWSNSSGAAGGGPAAPEALLEAVRATDDTYSAEVARQDCFDAADRPTACGGGGAAAAVAR